MYMEIEQNLIDKIEEITGIDYCKEQNKVLTTAVYGMLEDLVAQHQMLQDEFENFQQKVADNYMRIPIERQVDWRD